MTITKLEEQDFSKPLKNRIAESGLITIDLENLAKKEEIHEVDIKDFLFHEMILKEKEFREKVSETNWLQYENKVVAVHCSVDAIIQQWAYMVVGKELLNVTPFVYFGEREQVEVKRILEAIHNLNPKQFAEKRVIIKGCSSKAISDETYLEITKKLLPVVKSLMFGEACSTVPVFKKK